MTGPKMRLKLEDQVGYFEQPSYVIKRQPPVEKDDGLAERFERMAKSIISIVFSALSLTACATVQIPGEPKGSPLYAAVQLPLAPDDNRIYLLAALPGPCGQIFQ